MGTREDGLRAKGDALRAWRGRAGLTQEAAAAKIGASQGAWAAWERGQKAPEGFFAEGIDKLTEGAVSRDGWAFPRSSSLAARHASEPVDATADTVPADADASGAHKAAGAPDEKAAG